MSRRRSAGADADIAGRSMLLRLEALAVGGLFGTVAEDRHAAPAPGMATGVVGEQQRAGRALAGFHMGEIFRADEARQGLEGQRTQPFGPWIASLRSQ